jgi:hypothetical protein
VITLGWFNVSFYFGGYHADADLLRAKSYRVSQHWYDIQVALSRYIASLGASHRVIAVGQSPVPYDAETTRYLLGSRVDLVSLPNPEVGPPVPNAPGTGLAFIFFPGSEQYQARIRNLHPGGSDGQVHSSSGKLIFYTYTLPIRTH